MLKCNVFLLIALITSSAVAQQEAQFVYHVEATDCAAPPRSRAQTGFVSQSLGGLITALHGVAGCASITARQPSGSVPLIGLRILSADIPHDVALLGGPAPISGGLESTSKLPADGEKYLVWGHPSNVPGLYQVVVSAPAPAVRTLSDVIPPQQFIPLQRRNSPSVDSRILSINGNLQPGHSGAPIIDADGHVVAIADGGLAGGTVGIGWAILIRDVSLRPASNIDLADLGRRNVSLVFSYEAATLTSGEAEVRDKLTNAQRLCNAGHSAQAKAAFMDLAASFPADPTIPDYLQACEQLIAAKRSIQFAFLNSNGVFVYKHPNERYTAAFFLTIDGNLCGMFSNREGPTFNTCKLSSGEHTYTFDEVDVYNSKGHRFGQVSSCGRFVTISPSESNYGITICIRDPGVQCKIMPQKEAETQTYEQCPWGH